MSTPVQIRVIVLVVAIVLFLSYVGSRDTIRDFAGLSRGEKRALVRQAEEWSAPKFFRHIEIRPAPHDTAAVWIRESGRRWSVTWFTNETDGWKKTGWYLVDVDTDFILF